MIIVQFLEYFDIHYFLTIGTGKPVQLDVIAAL